MTMENKSFSLFGLSILMLVVLMGFASANSLHLVNTSSIQQTVFPGENITFHLKISYTGASQANLSLNYSTKNIGSWNLPELGLFNQNDFVLKNLGRLQSSKDVLNLLDCAQKVFDNISNTLF